MMKIVLPYDRINALIVLNDGRLVSASVGHFNSVGVLLQLADGRLASGSADTRIKIWDVMTGVCEQTLSVYNSEISFLLQLSDGRLASASDSSISIWNMMNGGVDRCLIICFFRSFSLSLYPNCLFIKLLDQLV